MFRFPVYFTLPLLLAAFSISSAQSSLSIARKAARASEGAVWLKKLDEADARDRLEGCARMSPEKSKLIMAFFRQRTDSLSSYSSISDQNIDDAILVLANSCDDLINQATRLSKLVPGGKSPLATINQYMDLIGSNPNRTFPNGAKGEQTLAVTAYPKTFPPGTPLFGLETQSAILNGAADFLVNRAKAELTTAFLNRLGETKNQERARFLRLYMPSSFEILSHASDMPTALLLPGLKHAARSDFRDLPLALSNQIPTCKEESLRLFGAAVRIATSMREGESPVTALERELGGSDFASDPVITKAANEFAALSKIYQDDRDLVAKILNGTDRTMLWYLDYYAIADRVSRDPGALPLLDVQGFDRNAKTVNEILESLRDLQTVVDTLRRRDPDSRSGSDYVKVLNLAARTARQGSQALYRGKDLRDFRRGWSWFDKALSLQGALEAGDYYQALQVAMPVLDTLYGTGYLDQYKTRKYLNFVAALATADSARDVNALLEAVAAPVGSYRAKRSKTSGTGVLTINSYLGMAMGGEYAGGDGSFSWTPVAPIGVELAFPVNGWFCIRSIGAFLPIVDLGLLASRRLDGDSEVDEGAEIGFAQVLSPGAFLTLGLSETVPTSIGGGFRYVPLLRDGASGKLSVLRVEGFVAIDIPFFQL